MPHVGTPWAGLVAIAAMFLIPFLPSWLFDGPRTVRHWPRRHVCGECGAPWAKGHVCLVEVEVIEHRPLRGELHRPRLELDRPQRRNPP